MTGTNGDWSKKKNLNLSEKKKRSSPEKGLNAK